MAKPKSFTDVIFQGVKVFIEGVQVPFNSININSGIGGLPTATISIPVQAGLMDIARFYSPKVHIFFLDNLNFYDKDNTGISKKQEKLLFSGLIAQVSYSKSKGLGAGSSITLSCVHKYQLMNECLIDYSGWLSREPTNANAGNAAVKADTANSQSSIVEALQGVGRVTSKTDPIADQAVSQYNPEGKVDVIPWNFKNNASRLVGMPGTLVNFWNQLKRAAFNKALSKNNNYENEGFIKMYMPLVEEGLKFFQRLGGHFPIEAVLADNRKPSCADTKKSKEILIPPCNHNFMKSSVEADMALSNLGNMLQFSGELTTIYQIFSRFFSAIDYDILTLTSPAKTPIPPIVDTTQIEVLDATTSNGILEGKTISVIDTIVKPRLPFYFSPICNVLFPSMYHTINVMYDEMNIPTRVDAYNQESIDAQGYNTHFRAPHSVRESIAKKVSEMDSSAPFNLISSTGTSAGAIGLFEQGRGVKMESVAFPSWLSKFSASSYGKDGSSDQPPDQNEDPFAYAALEKLKKGWEIRYPGEKNANMNPYSKSTVGLNSHHRVLFASADYFYTHVFARSKAGSVDCLFNPYIVPGYPMDILEKNPLYPSFHAHCTNVSHSISAESCSTSISFTAAMTYSELANYYIPFANPFLQVTLGLTDSPSLVNPTDTAYKTADAYYKYTLGVPSIAPSDLMDFNTGALYPHKWNDTKTDWERGSTDSMKGPNGGEMNPNLTFEGNLYLVQREVETREDIEDSDIYGTGIGVKFIDMTPQNYQSTAIKYKDAHLDEAAKFEIGQSQFLTYDLYFDKVAEKPTSTPSTSSITAGGATFDGETVVQSTATYDSTSDQVF